MHEGVAEKMNEFGEKFPYMLESIKRDTINLKNLWPEWVCNGQKNKVIFHSDDKEWSKVELPANRNDL
jgi:hypothetical protein